MRAKAEHGIAAFCILLGSAMLLAIRNFPKFQAVNEGSTGPEFFPICIAILLILVGIGEVFESRKSDKYLNFQIMDKKSLINISFVILGILLYIFALDFLGFIIATFMFTFGMMLVLRVKFIKNIIMSVILVIFMVLVFGKLFHLPLPVGIILPWNLI